MSYYIDFYSQFIFTRCISGFRIRVQGLQEYAVLQKYAAHQKNGVKIKGSRWKKVLTIEKTL